jgi:hypothetical protein
VIDPVDEAPEVGVIEELMEIEEVGDLEAPVDGVKDIEPVDEAVNDIDPDPELLIEIVGVIVLVGLGVIDAVEVKEIE